MIERHFCFRKVHFILNDIEKEILDDVIRKFKNYKAAEIVNYMYEERAYKITVNGTIIPFSLAREFRSF